MRAISQFFPRILSIEPWVGLEYGDAALFWASDSNACEVGTEWEISDRGIWQPGSQLSSIKELATAVAGLFRASHVDLLMLSHRALHDLGRAFGHELSI
jgi:hypothetical protein